MKGEFYSLEEFIKREKAKARRLRKTRWWRRQVERGICYYCGRRVPASELTMDHKIPLSRGGTSDKSNIVPACKECNNKKKYLLPWEWEEYLKRLRKEGDK
jgi:5-methylcytosine-specific restriction endonuclease McrA